MGKVLRVLVIVLLLLSIAALILGMRLFGMRELLKARTQKLEESVVALGTTVEAERPVLEEEPQLPARDVSSCEPKILDNPERSDFWTKYDPQLEAMSDETLRLDRQRQALMTYFKVDPVTGAKRTEGDGTMASVLTELTAKSRAQYDRLGETRHQLVQVRNELVDTIKELNQRKATLRSSLKEIEDLRATIAPLKENIRQLEQTVAEQKEEQRQLRDQISEQDRQLALLREQTQEKDSTIEQLKQQLDEAMAEKKTHREQPATTKKITSPAEQPEVTVSLQPGEKGRVVSVNDEWNYVILEFSDDFMKELFGDDLSGPMPTAELMIKTPSEPEKFVTKVKLTQVKKDRNLGIADILTNWQQRPVQEGDVVFF